MYVHMYISNGVNVLATHKLQSDRGSSNIYAGRATKHIHVVDTRTPTDGSPLCEYVQVYTRILVRKLFF